MAQASGSNEGKIPVFLLKTKSIDDAYEEQLSVTKDGTLFEPVFVPVLEHRLLDDEMDYVRDLLMNKRIGEDSKYGGMIFTSQRAVEAFAKLVEEGRGEDTRWPYLQDVPIYTVGPATSRALRSISQTPPLKIFGEKTGNGEALAHYILDHYTNWYRDRDVKPRLLFLVGEQRRDIIPRTLMDPNLPDDIRIRVDEKIVYGTAVMKSFEQDFSKILYETRDRDKRWVVVFSPTGCAAMLRVMGLLDPKTGKVRSEVQAPTSRTTYVATIGPTTKVYLQNEFGFTPDVSATTPSAQGIEKAMEDFIKNGLEQSVKS